MPSLSEYETHHALVEGLERFNGDTRGDVVNRVKVLQVMEETGITLQTSIASDYIATPDSSQHARQVLWREAHLFWGQLAVAYSDLVRHVLRGKEKARLAPWGHEILFKAMHYAGLTLRWEYYRGQRPGESAWRRLHRTYRMAEIAGVALRETEVEGRQTSCAREYVLTLLFDLANPHVFKPREVQSTFEILERLKSVPVPEISMRRDRHTHLVDFDNPRGPEVLGVRWAPGKRLRYLELQGAISELETRMVGAADMQTGLLRKQIARVIGRSGARRDTARRPVDGMVRVAMGGEAVIEAMQTGEAGEEKLENWKLRDESREGLGFILPRWREMLAGTLLVVSRPNEEKNWQLLAARWVREEDGQCLLGAESLSKHPKLVEVAWDGDAGEEKVLTAVFLPLTNTSHGAASNLLLHYSCYAKGRTVMLRDDGVVYRLSLGQVVESHENWLRVGFDVLARENLVSA